MVDKAPIAAWQDADFATEARTLTSRTFVAHVRYASTGGHTGPTPTRSSRTAGSSPTTAPSPAWTSWIVRLRELGVADLVQGQTDSERMFALITGETRQRDGDVDAGLVAAVGGSSTVCRCSR